MLEKAGGSGWGASKGPSIRVDGDSGASVSTTGRLRRFKGAVDQSRRRSFRDVIVGLVETAGFKGAVDQSRRRCRGDDGDARTRPRASKGPSIRVDGDIAHWAPPPMPILASKGPSIRVDGDTENVWDQALRLYALQRGRRSESTEIRSSASRLAAGCRFASKGPSIRVDGDKSVPRPLPPFRKWLQRGRRSESTEIGSRVKGYVIGSLALQRGRRSESTEIGEVPCGGCLRS